MLLNKYERSSNKSSIHRKRNHFKVIFREIKSNYQADMNNSISKTKKSKVKSTHTYFKRTLKENQNDKQGSIEKTRNREETYNKQENHKNLFSKVLQIEKINQNQKYKQASGKSTHQYVKECIDKKWQSFVSEQKLSRNTYQNFKKINQHKEKKNKKKQFFTHLCNPDLRKYNSIDFQSIKSVTKEKTNQLCNFVLGFQNYATKLQSQQFSHETSLSIFKRKIRKSEGITNIYHRLVKNKQFQGIRQSQLTDNFLSSAFANEYIRKNGKNSQKSKSILKMSHCIL